MNPEPRERLPDAATWRWVHLSPTLRAEAHVVAARVFLDQGADDTTAVLLSRLLPTFDLSPLAVSTNEAARMLGVSPGRVKTLRAEGRLPLLVEAYADGWCQARLFWRPVVEAWGEYRATTTHRPGRTRWEP